MIPQAFALLCALATLYCVASAPRAVSLLYVGIGMLVGLVLMLPPLLGLPFAPLVAVEPGQVALLLVLFALARLRSKVDARVVLCVGGVLAIVWMQALRGVGWPLLAALPFVAGMVLIAALGGLKRGFFPVSLQEEVTLLVLGGGLLVALVPGMVEGWDSAQALKGDVVGATAPRADVLWVAAGFVVLGAVFAWWKSNRRWNR